MSRFTPHHALSRAFLFALLASAACSHPEPAPAVQAPSAQTAPALAGAPGAAQLPPRLEASEWDEITKVVDGDTLHVQRAAGTAKLRLLCVDTEERLHPGQAPSPTKPQTVFGEETGQWAEKFFASLGKDGARPKVGLCFPGGREELDIYGRLLCHVILPDGSDYNLKLVREGRSPYFNKYGNSELEHEAFVAAQAAAQAGKLGIWNPATNTPATAGAPAAKRPYAELLDWWNARAAAIEGFRTRLKKGERTLADGAEYDAVEKLLTLPPTLEAELFCEIEKRVNEPNGELTLAVRSSRRDRHVRLFVPPEAREKLGPAKLDELTMEFHQNFVYARGKLRRGEIGLELPLLDPAQIRRAGPEPAPVAGKR